MNWSLHLSKYDFNVVHRAVDKHQAPNILSQLPTNGTNNTLLKKEVPVLVIASGEKFGYTATTIFALGAPTYNAPHFDIDSDGTDPTPPSLAELITAHPTDEFCQKSIKKLKQTGTEFSLHKNEALDKRVPIEGASPKLTLQSLIQRDLNMSHFLPIPVTLDNFFYRTACKEISNSLICI